MFFFLLTDFFVPINNFLIYRTGTEEKDMPWQDYIYKHKSYTSDNIIMIHVDQNSINAIEWWKQETQSLWIPKNYYTELTKFLIDSGAKAIGYDIIFMNADHKHEKEFSEVLRKNQNVVIATTGQSRSQYTSNKDTINTNQNNCIKDRVWEIQTCTGMPRSIYSKAHWGFIDMWQTSIHTIGNKLFGIQSKTSATSRESRMMSDDQKKYFLQNIPWKERMYSLPLALIEAGWDAQAIENLQKYIQSLEEKQKEKLKEKCYQRWDKKDQEICQKSIDREVPRTFGMQPYFTARELFDTENKLPYQSFSFINFFLSNPKGWVSLKNVGDNFDSDLFAGKYVIIGETGDILHDRFISPASGEYIPWMYSHAFLLDAILQNKTLSKISEAHLFFIIIGLTIIFVGIYFLAPKLISPIIFIISIAGTIFICRYIYDVHRIVIDILPVLMATSILTYSVTYIYKFFIIEKDKRLILNNFSRYLSPSVVKMIDTNNIEMTLGWEKKELSILFSDIAWFTTISEKLDTKDLFRLMTKYLSKMTNILTENHGTLDKYIGDAVMWFFGAPVDDNFHAFNACKTAIAMRKALSEINEDLQKDGLDTINFRIGISTGEVMVWNIGSENRFNYTVLWDVVNLASRLEGMWKEYGVQTIIAESTRQVIGNHFIVRELDYIAVKWKTVGTRIFELIDIKENSDNLNLGIYSSYESALRLYRDGRYLEAWKIFEKNMKNDPPSRIMALRCLSILKWEMQIENGIYKMTHK